MKLHDEKETPVGLIKKPLRPGQIHQGQVNSIQFQFNWIDLGEFDQEEVYLDRIH